MNTNKLLFLVAQVVLLSTFALSMTGCASVGVQVKPETVATFQKGVTTQSDVLHALGKPNTVLTNSQGEHTFIYSFAQTKVRAATYIPFVGAFAGGSDTHVATTMVVFNSAGVMTQYNSSDSTYGASLGGTGAPDTDQPRMVSQ